jgi:hypothetical protein
VLVKALRFHSPVRSSTSDAPRCSMSDRMSATSRSATARIVAAGAMTSGGSCTTAGASVPNATAPSNIKAINAPIFARRSMKRNSVTIGRASHPIVATRGSPMRATNSQGDDRLRDDPGSKDRVLGVLGAACPSAGEPEHAGSQQQRGEGPRAEPRRAKQQCDPEDRESVAPRRGPGAGPYRAAGPGRCPQTAIRASPCRRIGIRG